MAALASASHPRAIVAFVIDWVAHGVRVPGASSVACMYGRGVLEDSVQDPARPGATIRLVIAVVVAPALVLCALGVVLRVIRPVAVLLSGRLGARRPDLAADCRVVPAPLVPRRHPALQPALVAVRNEGPRHAPRLLAAVVAARLRVLGPGSLHQVVAVAVHVLLPAALGVWAGARTWATGALTPVRTALRARHVARGAHLLLVGVAVDRLGEEALERTAARRITGSGVHILRGRQGYRGLLSGRLETRRPDLAADCRVVPAPLVPRPHPALQPALVAVSNEGPRHAPRLLAAVVAARLRVLGP